MSAHRLRLKLALLAQVDFEEVLFYTMQTWGEGQRQKYKDKINHALNLIAENPQVGHHDSGYRVYPVGKHNIYYHIQDSMIYVVRILHEKMNARHHLAEAERAIAFKSAHEE